MSPPQTEDFVDMTEEFDEALETPQRPALSAPPGRHLKATSPEYVPGTLWSVEKGSDSPATGASTAASPAAPSLGYDGLPYDYGAEYGSPGYDEHFGYDAADFYGDGAMDPSCMIDPSHLLAFGPYDLTPSIPSMDFTSNGQYTETPWGAFDEGLAAGSEYYAWQAAKNVEAIDAACRAISETLNVSQPPPPEMPVAPPGQHFESSGDEQTVNENGKVSLELMKLVGARVKLNTGAGESPIYDRSELLQFRASGIYSEATVPGFRACKLPAS